MPAAQVLESLAAAGLKGRGGAGFPTARKIATVASTGVRAVVVANGTEGEPLSMKDKVLLTNSPHLVLDGLALAADLVGATRRVVCIESGNPTVEVAVRRALLERGEEGVEVFATPRRYVSGQENALVDLINGGRGSQHWAGRSSGVSMGCRRWSTTSRPWLIWRSSLVTARTGTEK